MVNNPDSVSPSGPKGPHPAHETEKKHPGAFNATEPHKFLGMNFTADQWNKLMNIMLQNMNNYIKQTFQKMTEKMKKDWKRARGDDD
jgi:hypothetical protein